ncbi:MAG TPA: alpha/beta hydrolase [Streptomyces sp.]|nr:alpha/beta hydrolase [Streptomyces sp.]
MTPSARRQRPRASGPLLAPVPPHRAGVPWLVLPGWGQSAAHWVPTARWAAGSGVCLWAADLAGAAAAAAAPRGTVERTTEIVRRLVEEGDVSRARLIVGHSAGAPLAVLAAALMTGVRAVVLIEPVASHFGLAPRRVKDPSDAVPTAGAASDATADPEYERLRRRHPMASQSTLRAIAAALTHLPASAGPQDGSGRPSTLRIPATAEAAGRALAALRVPVLVVRGQASALLTPAEAGVLAGAARAGACATVPGAGHSPHIDQPRETARTLLDFAAGTTGPAVGDETMVKRESGHV